jgi:hypothetical protein
MVATVLTDIKNGEQTQSRLRSDKLLAVSNPRAALQEAPLAIAQERSVPPVHSRTFPDSIVQGDRDDPQPNLHIGEKPLPDWARQMPKISSKGDKANPTTKVKPSSSLIENETLRIEIENLKSQLLSTQETIGRLSSLVSQQSSRIDQAGRSVGEMYVDLDARMTSDQSNTRHIQLLTIGISFSTMFFIAMSSLVALLSYKRGSPKEGVGKAKTFAEQKREKTKVFF